MLYPQILRQALDDEREERSSAPGRNVPASARRSVPQPGVGCGATPRGEAASRDSSGEPKGLSYYTPTGRHPSPDTLL